MDKIPILDKDSNIAFQMDGVFDGVKMARKIEKSICCHVKAATKIADSGMDPIEFEPFKKMCNACKKSLEEVVRKIRAYTCNGLFATVKQNEAIYFDPCFLTQVMEKTSPDTIKKCFPQKTKAEDKKVSVPIVSEPIDSEPIDSEPLLSSPMPSSSSKSMNRPSKTIFQPNFKNLTSLKFVSFNGKRPPSYIEFKGKLLRRNAFKNEVKLLGKQFETPALDDKLEGTKIKGSVELVAAELAKSIEVDHKMKDCYVHLEVLSTKPEGRILRSQVKKVESIETIDDEPPIKKPKLSKKKSKHDCQVCSKNSDRNALFYCVLCNKCFHVMCLPTIFKSPIEEDN